MRRASQESREPVDDPDLGKTGVIRPGSGLDLCDAVERAEGVADVTLVPREKSSL